MTCEELQPDYTAYALGILDDPECAEITGHLSRKCENCVPGVANALAAVSRMAGAVKSIEPPKELRRRVMGMVDRRAEEKRSSNRGWSLFVPWGVAAVLAIVLVSVALPGRRSNTEKKNPETAKLEQALSILNDPATKDVAFGETQQPARGRVYAHPQLGVLFMAARLPKIDADKAFELWVIPAKGNPIPAGTFESQSDNTALYIRPGPLEQGASAFAVTVEPRGGSPLPTTKPFIVAGIG